LGTDAGFGGSRRDRSRWHGKRGSGYEQSARLSEHYDSILRIGYV
jgi:hypothetical protein